MTDYLLAIWLASPIVLLIAVIYLLAGRSDLRRRLATQQQRDDAQALELYKLRGTLNSAHDEALHLYQDTLDARNSVTALEQRAAALEQTNQRLTMTLLANSARIIKFFVN